MKSPPDVVFIDQTAQLGGAEHNLLNLLPFVVASKDVILFEEGPFLNELHNRGISASVLAVNLPRTKTKSAVLDLIVDLPGVLASVLFLSERLKGARAVYLNSPKAAVIGALAARLRGLKIIVHVHDIFSSAHFGVIQRWVMLFVLNNMADLVIANSRATAEDLMGLGVLRAKIEVIYNGFCMEGPYAFLSKPDEKRQNILRSELDLEQGKRVIGCFSRISPWKGQDVLLQATQLVEEDCIFLLVGAPLFGEQDYERKLKEKALGFDGRQAIRFTGFRTDVADLMNLCDLIVNPSIEPEPFGRTIIESQLCGKVVLATTGGAGAELIEDGLTGFLIPPADAVLLADRINSLLASSEQMERVGRAAKKSAAERFSAQEIAEQTNKCLREVLQT